MSITRVRVVIIGSIGTWSSMACARARSSLYGTGSSTAHAYYVTKWRSTYTQSIFKVHAEKMTFRRSFYFLKTDIVHCALENGADLYVNEDQ